MSASDEEDIEEVALNSEEELFLEAAAPQLGGQAGDLDLPPCPLRNNRRIKLAKKQATICNVIWAPICINPDGCQECQSQTFGVSSACFRAQLSFYKQMGTLIAFCLFVGGAMAAVCCRGGSAGAGCRCSAYGL